MPVEIEAKMKVEDLDGVRARLAECGAERAGLHFEVNTFYDTEDRTLLAADKGLRLRRNRDDATGGETYVLTFKGPRLHGPLKSRDEFELVVADGGDADQLLHALGYVTILSFEKRRESWTLGDCKVELDDLPHLGCFVEVEGPREEAVLRVRQMLRLADRPMIKTGYAALLSTWLQEHGKPQRVVRFER